MNFAETKMIGDLEVASDLLGPGAPVLDKMVKLFCLASRSTVATRCPDLISATAICIATVDLPDPPFSFATTITRVDGINPQSSGGCCRLTAIRGDGTNQP